MNSSSELFFGIIGCGNIGQTHMRAIAEIPGAKIAAVFDVNENSAKKAAQKYECSYYSDYKKLIEDKRVNVVDICTPSGLRRDIAIYAAENKKHIVVEKPIEVTVKRAQDIVNAARDNGVTAHGIFGKRYDDLFRWLKKTADNGRFGKLFSADVTMKWYRPSEYYKNTWRGTWSLDGGGALMNQCVHYVDVIQWIMGMPKSVYAHTDRYVHSEIETEDTAAVLMKFNNGIGMVQASTAMYPGFSARFSINGTKGGAIIEDERLVDLKLRDMNDNDRELLREFAPEGGVKENVVTHVVSDTTLHRRQLSEITESIRNKTESDVNGEEASKAVKIIMAAYKSAEEDKEVFLYK